MAYSKPLPQRTPQPRRSRRLQGQEPSAEPSPERVVGSATSSPFRGPVSPNGENPSPRTSHIWHLSSRVVAIQGAVCYAHAWEEMFLRTSENVCDCSSIMHNLALIFLLFHMQIPWFLVTTRPLPRHFVQASSSTPSQLGKCVNP